MPAKKTKVEIKERVICGQPEGVIRKAYFENNLNVLLNQIQASGKYDEGDVEQLGLYLESLRTEGKDVIDKILKVFGGKLVDNGTPPSVEELRAGASDAEWRVKADQAIAYIEETLTKIRGNIAEKKTFASRFWGDTAMIFISMEELIDKDLVYKRQLYKARLTQIIDDHGVSRKEAEERAELTKEYFDYKSIDKLSNRLKEIYTFARRRDDETNHR